MDDRTTLSSAVALNKLDPALEQKIRAATDALLADQQPDGHWVFELEADATIPAEYVLMVHYFAEEPNLELDDKISYWARTVIVPLLVLQALKPRAKNPRGVTIDELFHEDPKTVGPPHKAPHQKWAWFLFFRAADIVLRALEPVMPKGLRKRAIAKAAAFVNERLK